MKHINKHCLYIPSPEQSTLLNHNEDADGRKVFTNFFQTPIIQYRYITECLKSTLESLSSIKQGNTPDLPDFLLENNPSPPCLKFLKKKKIV